MLSNTMLDTLANSGAEIDDTPFILKAQETMRVDPGVDRARRSMSGEISMEDVFDREYRLIEGSNPGNMTNRFSDFADRYVRPILDRVEGRGRAADRFRDHAT